ncbi:MAG: P44/Msp2 family outer membrane protein, partial [Anaplasma sp.]
MRRFKIEKSGSNSEVVIPYKSRHGWRDPSPPSHNFDWEAPEPKISFKDSKLMALGGAVGYAVGGARVEV